MNLQRRLYKISLTTFLHVWVPAEPAAVKFIFFTNRLVIPLTDNVSKKNIKIQSSERHLGVPGERSFFREIERNYQERSHRSEKRKNT